MRRKSFVNAHTHCRLNLNLLTANIWIRKKWKYEILMKLFSTMQRIRTSVSCCYYTNIMSSRDSSLKEKCMWRCCTKWKNRIKLQYSESSQSWVYKNTQNEGNLFFNSLQLDSEFIFKRLAWNYKQNAFAISRYLFIYSVPLCFVVGKRNLENKFEFRLSS
jgi:hypothetical protein